MTGTGQTVMSLMSTDRHVRLATVAALYHVVKRNQNDRLFSR
jgi:hypothetical protein